MKLVRTAGAACMGTALRGVLLAAAAATGAAADVHIECPATGHAPPVALRFDANVLSVTDARGTAALPGSMQELQPGSFGIRGAGAMDALMPNPAALDECLAARLKQQGASANDVSALGYVANLCRLKLTPSGSVQEVEAEFTATALDAGKATVFIQRRYKQPSKVTGAPLQLDEVPPRDCAITKGP
jgi:hypothetical protein